MSGRTNGGGSSLKHLMEAARAADIPIAVVDVRDDWGELTGCIIALADPSDFDLARRLRDDVLARHSTPEGGGNGVDTESTAGDVRPAIAHGPGGGAGQSADQVAACGEATPREDAGEGV
jgi:hypothetical protein